MKLVIKQGVGSFVLVSHYCKQNKKSDPKEVSVYGRTLRSALRNLYLVKQILKVY